VFSSLKEHVADRTLSAVEVGAVQRTIELNKLEQLARFRRGMGVMATVGATLRSSGCWAPRWAW
jgi:hypothetical protein